MKAFLFPGQGSQKVGMGADLFDNYKEYVEDASALLGYCLKTLCLEDPNGELGQTQFTQPALYVVSALTYLDQINNHGVEPDVVAGHSLGEYNALFAAGAFSFEAGLGLVKKRAELMSKANGGGMAAIMGCPANDLKQLFREAAFQGLDIASVNSSNQVVISGPPELISAVASHFESSDVQCYPLNVSAAFHSRYMKSAADEFMESLQAFDFAPLKIPVISNVFARPYGQAESSELLASQIFSPVLWKDSIQFLMAMGVDSFSEVGPGSVLTNMQRNIAPDESLVLSESEVDAIIQKNIENQDSQTVSVDAFEIVSAWNKCCPIGTKVTLKKSGDVFQTSSSAMVLFGRKAAIYLGNKKGFFSLKEITPLNLAKN